MPVFFAMVNDREGENDMGRRLDDIPVYERIATSVSAADFNLVQRAFHRLGEPLNIPLTGLRRLELTLDREAWVVVDRDLNDMPVLAWTNFQTEGRTALHEPVSCTLQTYHMHASVILGRVIEFMAKELTSRISARQMTCEIERVVPLKKT